MSPRVLLVVLIALSSLLLTACGDSSLMAAAPNRSSSTPIAPAAPALTRTPPRRAPWLPSSVTRIENRRQTGIRTESCPPVGRDPAASPTWRRSGPRNQRGIGSFNTGGADGAGSRCGSSCARSQISPWLQSCARSWRTLSYATSRICKGGESRRSRVGEARNARAGCPYAHELPVSIMSRPMPGSRSGLFLR